MMPPALSLSLLVLATFGAQADASGEQGLCHPSEEAFFTCQTAKKTTISLCAPQPKALQYRYGTPGKVQLAFPSEVVGSSKRFRIATYARLQVHRTEVTFSNAGVDYALFDYTEDGASRAGVRVVMPDGKEREFVCKGPVDSRLTELTSVLECDADNALNGGACR